MAMASEKPSALSMPTITEPINIDSGVGLAIDMISSSSMSTEEEPGREKKCASDSSIEEGKAGLTSTAGIPHVLGRSKSSPVNFVDDTLIDVSAIALDAVGVADPVVPPAATSEFNEVVVPPLLSNRAVPSNRLNRASSIPLTRVQGRFEVVDIPGVSSDVAARISQAHGQESSQQNAQRTRATISTTQISMSNFIVPAISAPATMRAGRFEVSDFNPLVISTSANTSRASSATSSQASSPICSSQQPLKVEIAGPQLWPAVTNPSSVSRSRKVAGRFEVTDISHDLQCTSPAAVSLTAPSNRSHRSNADDELVSAGSGARRANLDFRLQGFSTSDIFSGLQSRFTRLQAENEQLRSENAILQREVAKLRAGALSKPA